MFYLTTHSTHFIYGYMVSHMVKDHSDCERKPATATWAILSDYMHHPTDRMTYTFITPVVEHWLEREIAWILQSRVVFICYSFFLSRNHTSDTDVTIKNNTFNVLSTSLNNNKKILR